MRDIKSLKYPIFILFYLINRSVVSKEKYINIIYQFAQIELENQVVFFGLLQHNWRIFCYCLSALSVLSHTAQRPTLERPAASVDSQQQQKIRCLCCSSSYVVFVPENTVRKQLWDLFLNCSTRSINDVFFSA